MKEDYKQRVAVIGSAGKVLSRLAMETLAGGLSQRTPIVIEPTPKELLPNFPHGRWLEEHGFTPEQLRFNGRNSGQLKLRTSSQSYPNNSYYHQYVHSVIKSGNLKQINNSKDINPCNKNRTVVAIKKVDSTDDTTRYTLLMLDGGFNNLLNCTKGFKFTGEPQDVICKQIIMWMYMKSHKYFKKAVLEIPLLGTGVTRENFTKALKAYSGDSKELLDLVVQERLKDFDSDSLNWG